MRALSAAVYDERRYGIDLHARKALNEFSYIRVGYTLQDVDIHDVDPDASQQIKDEEGNRWKAS
jgi:hypothetical protein